jgi:CBS domain containing-hemolysin-like protein
MALSACQMGITMASLGLGWIGEPALAHLIRPILESVGMQAEPAIHGVAFALAFSLITALHIVIGEQFPKIYAIRQPVLVVGWSSIPLKVFYVLFYPFMWLLDRVTSSMLRMVGIETSGEHEAVLSEEEIRASLSIAYSHGDLTKNEHQLLDAAFKFDDQVARQIMLPRSEVVIFDLTRSNEDNLELARKTKHTRFPLCNGSMDDIKGVVHIKDLVGVSPVDTIDFKKMSRPPLYVPEALPVSVLLQEFRNTKQHLAFVEDEYGTTMGIVTLENVFELLVGEVLDEFDMEKAEITKEALGKYIVDGDLSLTYINDYLNLELSSEEAETLSGLLIEKKGLSLLVNQKIPLTDGIIAQVITLKKRRALKVRLILPKEIIEE